MIKSVFAATAALSMSAGAAIAGPYVNIETNAGYTGNDYNAATTDLHVGFEGAMGDDAGYYLQAGPAIVSVDGEDTTTEFSGKAGVGVDIAENVNVYGEVAFITVDGSDDNNYGLKAGVKYSF
jgi:outer membrane autotransporter protein